MILITGATSNLGKATIKSLLAKSIAATDLAALVRDETKATELKATGIQVRLGDYQDIASLKRAFQGVDKVLLISSSAAIADRFEQHKNAIDAAKEMGVRHLVYTGFAMKDLTQSSMTADVQYHAYTAAYLKQATLPYTVMHNTFYADLIPLLIGKDALEQGVSIPAGEGKIPFLPLAEMAEALAVVLTTPGHEKKEYVMAAETAFSFAEIADMLAASTGKTIAYHQPEVRVYIAQLVQAGLSEDDAAYIARYAKAFAHGEFAINKSDVKQLLGRSPVRLADFLRSVYTN
jgi:NAD(P)H dehydrogenase (quinone)